MTWFKVDDKFWSHPKVMFTSLAARGMWASAGAYCADHLTDGVIPSDVLHVIIPGTHVAVERLAAELVCQGLWEAIPGGWRFHDWGDHQPCADDVRAARKSNQERQRRHRERRRAATANEPRNATVTPLVTRYADVQSRPDPTRPVSTRDVTS